MATLSEEERKRLLEQVREMQKNQPSRPTRHITNPKFVEPVTPELTPGGYDVDEHGNPKKPAKPAPK
jgi:hypothetical protein